MVKLHKAVFLNRDATIIKTLSNNVNSPSVELFKDTVSSLLQLQKDYSLIIVTEQNEKQTDIANTKINSKIEQILNYNGIKIDKWLNYKINDKKNNSFSFIREEAHNFKIDLSLSWFISDRPDDMNLINNSIPHGLYLLTERGANCLKKLSTGIQVFHNLTEAAERILRNNNLPIYNNFCNIIEGAATIKAGGLVAFPTETVYGLGADVFKPESIKKIFELKKRPFFDPLISHISNLEMLKLLTDNVSQTAKKLIENFWPGPLTLVFSKKKTVSNLVTGGNPTVAIRMPIHPIALQLIEKAGTPIAAPSANSFGKTSPTTAKHVIEQLGSEGYKIIDGGACRVGVESTVLSLVENPPVILRQGGVSQEEIERVIGPVKNVVNPVLKNLDSPGLLENHYAPETPLYFKNLPCKDNYDSKTGLIIFGKPEIKSAGPIENLSTTQNAEEAALNLYAAMRRLDKLELNKIIAYRLPDVGIGRAVNDRIQKSSIKK